MPPTARKSAATADTVEVPFEGETYLIPTAEEWSLDVLEAFEDGKVATMIRALVGPEGWTLYRSKPRKVRDLNAFATAIQEALGLGN